jgi:hypothetical protein
MAILRKPHAFLALASLCATQVAAKEEPRPFDAGDYVAPFIVVCLQHYGDAARQISSAKDMHRQTHKDFWKLESEDKVGPTTRLSFGGSTVTVKDGGRHHCSFSAFTDAPVSLDEFGAGVSRALGGVSPTKRTGPPEDIVWVIQLGESETPLVVAATTSPVSGRNAVTLSAQDLDF